METLYPVGYGTRLVTWDVLEATYKPYAHPAAWRVLSNFLKHQGGKFGIGGGRRLHGAQPNKPGFAPEGESFHQDQPFPSGKFYAAWDLVVVNPGYVHRSPRWDEVPAQGTAQAIAYGFHMNVGKPGEKGSESWHGMMVPLDGYRSWVNQGRYDLDYNYPILIRPPRPQPLQPPTPSTQPASKEIIVQFESRNLARGSVGPDVKFFQRLLNDFAMQGLILDGVYKGETERAVKNFQVFFGKLSDGTVLVADGKLGAFTQRGIIEVALKAA